MENISYRTISDSDLSEIDQREQIRVGYDVIDGKLISSDVNWDVPSFSPVGTGGHSVSRQIEFCRQHIRSGARATGAEQIYVSATPSQSAVGIYMRFGFEPVEDPLPELYELEPDDIHMAKML